jgi:hypothetical protein
MYQSTLKRILVQDTEIVDAVVSFRVMLTSSCGYSGKVMPVRGELQALFPSEDDTALTWKE